MLNSSESMSANDVCVRCSVRRSETASNLELGPIMEMVCTMRHWTNDQENKNDKLDTGSEIILKLISMLSSTDSMVKIKTERFRSPSPGSLRKGQYQQSREVELDSSQNGLKLTRPKSPALMYHCEKSGSFGSIRARSNPRSSRRRGMLPPSRNAAISAAFAVNNEPNASESSNISVISFNIKMKDIIRVDIESSAIDNDPSVEGFLLYLISYNGGFFELNFSSSNSRDVLLAFLRANIPEDRIASIDEEQIEAEIPSLQHQTSSMDMEKFQAKEVINRIQNETFGSKCQRKFNVAFTRFTDVACALSECICGADLCSAQVGEASTHQINDIEEELEMHDESKIDSFEKCLNTSLSSTTADDKNKESPPKTITLQDHETDVPMLEMSDGEKSPSSKSDKKWNSASSEVTVATTKSTLDDQLSGTHSQPSIDMSNNPKLSNAVDRTPDKIDDPQSPPLVTVDI